MVMGTDFVLTGEYSMTAFFASLTPFFLVSNLLLLNQFPDVEADNSIGRSHFPGVAGRRKSSFIYTAFVLMTYMSIICGVELKYFSQELETYDKMTGKTMYSTKTIIVSKDEVNGYATRFLKSSSGSIIWSIRFVGCGGCIDEDAKIDILFRSGKKMTIYGNNDFNCDNKLVVYFGGTFGKKKELQALCNNEVETIRVHTTQSFCQEDFTEEDSKEFINGLNCIK